jgi:iron complex outermembrane receptor protein
MQDRIHLPGRIQLLAGGRFDSVRDHNYSPCAYDRAELRTHHRQNHLAAAIRESPSIRSTNLTLYGNYGVMLSLGPQATVVG